MNKIDYEGCWKDFKRESISLGIYTEEELLEYEKRNTRNSIELKRRTSEGKECFWREAYFDKSIELATLRQNLKNLSLSEEIK
jgi:hypothetical protein